MSKTNKIKSSQISNPFSTGGGGVSFEHRVQASFLLGLLIDGFAPVLNQPIQKVSFQTKIHGFDLDDIMVVTNSPHRESKMLCQIKHKLSFTSSNKESREVICAAWGDYNNAKFNKSLDKLVVITGLISSGTIESLRYIYQLAISCTNSLDFSDKLSKGKFTSDKTRNKFDEIKKLLNLANGSEVSLDDVWGFFKVFVLLVYDLDYQNSINATLIESLIKSNCHADANDVWARMCEYAAFCDQSAADITLDNFDASIKEKFGLNSFPPDEAVGITPDAFWAKLSLLGEWEDNNPADCAIVEKVIGAKYEQVRTTLQDLLAQEVDYIKWNNGRWKITNPESMAHICHNYYYNDTISTIFSVASDILQERDKRLNNDNRLLFEGKAFDYSLTLRKNILVGINILINKVELPNCSQQEINRTKILFIRNLFDNCTWERLASIGDLLCLIAEIAPDWYLNTLEKYLKNNTDDVRKLLPQSDNYMWTQNYLCPLLWSIETLAWNDRYLVSCIRCLCELNMLQHDYGNIGNTPKASIISILLPWHHCTLASLETRKAAITLMLREYLSTEWESIKALMPRETSCSTYTAKPKYMLHVPENAELNADYNEMSIYIFQQAVSFASDDINKLSDMIKYIEYYYSDLGVQFLESIKCNYKNWSDEDLFIVWNKLEDCKYKILWRNEGEEPKSEAFSVLCHTTKTLAPSNIIYKARRLFVAKYDEFSVKTDDYHASSQARTQAQVDGLTKVWKTHGLAGVLQLTAGTTKESLILGRLGGILDINGFTQVLTYCYNTDNIFLIKTVTESFINRNGVKTLLSIDWSNYSPNYIADILVYQHLTDGLLEVVSILLKNNEQLYWSKAIIPTYYEKTDYELEIVINHLIKENRYIAIINMLGHIDKSVPIKTEILYNILIKAATTNNAQDRLDSFAVTNLIKYLQQEDVQNIDMDKLCNIEFLYLPWLNDHSPVRPRALNNAIANDPRFFCELILRMYKGTDDEKTEKLPEELGKRLFDILFRFKIVPGVDWFGNFHKDAFVSWINTVIEWGRQNSRDVVVQHTIGSGLSYAINENDEIDQAIVEVLDNRDYDAIREGFSMGIHNQRGVYIVDPEGKAEKQLNEKYERMAIKFEQSGYSRIAQTLHKIADNYLKEIDSNKYEDD